MNAKTALAALGILSAPGLALASDEPCSGRSISGTYGFSGTGLILPSNPKGLPPGPAAAAVVMTFERTGRMYGTQVVSFNGSVISDINYDGTYVLNPDCTMTFDVPNTFHNFGVLVAGGSEIFMMSGDAGVVASFHMKRLDKR